MAISIFTQQVALKLIDLKKDQKVVFQTVQEIELLANLNHEHILEFLDYDEEEGIIQLLTEYCCNGDLDEYTKQHRGEVLEEPRLVEWIRQITSALEVKTGRNLNIGTPKIVTVIVLK